MVFKQRAASLVEVLVSLSLFASMMILVMTVMLNAYKINHDNGNQLLNNLANENQFEHEGCQSS